METELDHLVEKKSQHKSYLIELTHNKYLLGLNYVSGLSQFRTVVHLASNLSVIVLFTWYIYSNKNIYNIPTSGLGVISAISAFFVLLDMIYVAIKGVVSPAAILTPLIDTIFWVRFPIFLTINRLPGQYSFM